MYGHCLGRAACAALVALGATAAQATTIQIRVTDLAFAPAQVAAHVGDTIEWVNADFVAHTATARNGVWDVMLPPHASRSMVVTTSGTFDYYCKFHPNMTGQIAVSQ